MISKTSRWNTTKTFNDMECPGPGSYTPQGPLVSAIDVSNMSVKPQSMFAKPRHFRDEIVDVKEEVPGPGRYDLNGGYLNGKTIREINDEASGSSFFRDGMNRFKKPVPQTEQVCPGSYNVGSSDEAMYR